MEWIKLGKLADVELGKTPARKQEKYWNGNHTWVSIADLQGKYIDDSKEQITDLAIDETNIKSVPVNTVIMSFKLSIGKRAITKKKLYTNEAIASFHIKDSFKLNTEYLYYSLGFINLLEDANKSVKGKTLNKKILNSLKIPVPSIEIQKQIVQVLDQIQALIDKRKEQIENLDQLIESIFYHMFGDPVRNEKGWEISIMKEKTNCIVPARDKPKSFTGNIPWITINDLEQSGNTIVSKKGLGLTKKEVSQVKRKTIPVGSVLMSCVGDLGVTSINGVEVVINQQIHAFECKGDLNNIYLRFYIPKMKAYLDSVANSTTVKYINKTKCENIPLILPPLSLQNKFATKVQTIEKQKKRLNQSLELMEENYKSLMDKAFKGQLF